MCIEQVASYVRSDLIELTEALLLRWTSWADELVLKDNPDLRSFVNHRWQANIVCALFTISDLQYLSRCRLEIHMPDPRNLKLDRRFLDEVEEALVPLSKVSLAFAPSQPSHSHQSLSVSVSHRQPSKPLHLIRHSALSHCLCPAHDFLFTAA